MSSNFLQPDYAQVSKPAWQHRLVHAPVEEAVPVLQQVLTWMLFWPTLCLIARQAPYFAGPARDALSYEQGAAAGAGTDYHVTLYITLAFQAVFAVLAMRSIWVTLKRNPLITAGLVLILSSTLWSSAQGNTLRMGVEVCLCTLFACYLAVRMAPGRLMSFLMLMGGAASLLSILFVIALPSYGIFAGYGGAAWNGICDHKNTLGLSMAYLLTPVFFVHQCRRLHRILYAGLILFMIAMSQSRGAWIYTAGLLCFVGLLKLSWRLRKRESIVLILVCLFSALVLGFTFVKWFGVIAPMLGKSASMSGRTDIYSEVWHSIMKAPVLGYGYGSFWGVNPEAERIGLAIGWPNIGYSESGILELALQLGFVGVALVVLMIGRAGIQAARLFRSPHYSSQTGWYITILFLAVLTNIDAGWLLVSGTLDWVMILIACIGLESETRRAQAARELPECRESARRRMVSDLRAAD